jgi:TRAP transporter TAXI family solute receptor
MKHYLSLAWLLCSMFVVFGCGSDAGPSGRAPASSTSTRQFLSIGTAPAGGAFFPVGGAIGEVLNENRGDRNWQVTAEATKGSQENIRRLVRGELDLALANAAITYFAVRGEAGWDRPYPVRAVMTLAPNVALFVTRESSGIRRIPELRGKRVVLGPAGAGFDFFLRPLLEAHGVAWDELTELHNTQAGAVDMLADGSAAAAFLGGAVPTASITQASSSQGVFFIPYETAAIDKLTGEYLFFRRGSVPAGTYRGQDADFDGLDVGSMHLITSADRSDELIYELTRVIYGNREKVVAKHAAGRAINPTNVVRDTGTEFHPGAVRFYREIGIWPDGEASP